MHVWFVIRAQVQPLDRRDDIEVDAFGSFSALSGVSIHIQLHAQLIGRL